MKNIDLGGKTGVEISDAKNISLNNLTVSNEKGAAVDISFSDHISIDQIEVKKTDETVTPFQLKQVTNLKIGGVKYAKEGELVSIEGSSETITLDESIPENKVTTQ